MTNSCLAAPFRRARTALVTEDQTALSSITLARYKQRALMAASSIGLLVGASVGSAYLGGSPSARQQCPTRGGAPDPVRLDQQGRQGRYLRPRQASACHATDHRLQRHGDRSALFALGRRHQYQSPVRPEHDRHAHVGRPAPAEVPPDPRQHDHTDGVGDESDGHRRSSGRGRAGGRLRLQGSQPERFRLPDPGRLL